MNDLEKLFVSELKDIYDGEQQLVQALSQMEKSATSGALKEAFHEHMEQTKTHVNRLERVFQQIGQTPKRRACHGIEGIVNEGEMLLKTLAGNSSLDAALIASGQKAEHYEITSYGSLCTWAEELGYNSALQVLKENLNDEKNTEEKLNQLAESLRQTEAAVH